MTINRILFFLAALFAILIGLYPLLSLLLQWPFGLLEIKDPEVISQSIWNMGFYTHISMGGIALLIGWAGFIKKLRDRNIGLHRTIGKIYVIAALASALGGMYIGFHSYGGWVAASGFVAMGLVWFYTTWQAYQFIRAKNIVAHESMMVYSYATCFAGVTFRLWLPLLVAVSGNFDFAYPIAAWICWIPNLLVAYFINTASNNAPALQKSIKV